MARPGTGERSQLTFNGGELSPLLHGRVDLDIWGRGCKQLENALPRKYGNAERRQGTRFVGEVKDSSGIVRLLPFRYSVSDTVCIEAGAGYFRFFKDGAPVLSAGEVYEVESPYTEAELFSLQYLELNDVLFLVHPDHPPYRLMRYSDVSWVMEECPFDEPVFQDQNITTTTIAPSATTGTGISLTASSALFTASMVGGYFKLGQRRASTNVTLTETAEGSYTSSSLSIKGKVSIRSSGTWSGTLLLQRQDGATWNTVYTFVSSLDQNFNQSLEQSDKEYHNWRLSWDITNIDGDPVKAVLETEEGFVYGWARVTGFTSSTVVTANVESAFQDTSSTDLWMEGSWSPYRGYPAAVSYYQDRVVYGGTYHQPQTVWGSCTGDYYNFEGITGVVSIKDTDAFAQTMGSTERVFIRWMEQLGNVLIVGTSAGEFSLSGTNGGDDPISATSVLIRLQTPTGDSGVKPVRVGTSLLHVQRDGKKLYELSYSIQSYSFADADVTQFAEHITGTGSGILDMAFQRQPDPVLWCVRDDGVLLACVYDQAQKVVAWSRMTTQGTVESVCSLYSTSGDEIWLVVKRELGDGSEVKYIERLMPLPFNSKTDACYVDCALEPNGYNYLGIVEDPGYVYIGNQPASKSGSSGDVVDLAADVSNADTVTWYKDGTAISLLSLGTIGDVEGNIDGGSATIEGTLYWQEYGTWRSQYYSAELSIWYNNDYVDTDGLLKAFVRVVTNFTQDSSTGTYTAVEINGAKLLGGITRTYVYDISAYKGTSPVFTLWTNHGVVGTWVPNVFSLLPSDSLALPTSDGLRVILTLATEGDYYFIASGPSSAVQSDTANLSIDT